RSTTRREFDVGRSTAKRNTFESRNALVGILRPPDVLPEPREGHPAPRARLDYRPEVPGPQEAEIGPVLDERGPDRLRFRREQPGAQEPVEELRLRAPEFD